MERTARLPAGAWSLVVVFALASLVFLGNPGCGCGDDDFGQSGSPRCCCTFEWLPPRDISDTSIVISLENEGASLDAVVAPALLTGVQPLVGERFQVCVSLNHTLGDSVQVVLRGQTSGTEYGRALLIYSEQCRPTIEPLSNNLNLVSIDCGGETLLCCCDFEWLPGPNVSGDILLTAENVSTGLTVQIIPSTLTGVEPGVIENFTICINADHNLLDGFQLVATTTPGGLEVGREQIVYRMPCTPELGAVAGAPSMDLASPDCIGDPLRCCCDFEWLPPQGLAGDVSFTAENASAGLNPVITPSTVTSVEMQSIVSFTICIDGNHNLLDSFEFVARTSPGGVEIGRMSITYRQRCTPDVGDIPDFGSLNMTSTECGGEDLQCCCQVEWVTGANFPTTNVSFQLQNVDSSLQPASVTPATATGVGANQTSLLLVCVSAHHTTGATMDLVITDTNTGGEIARLPLSYDEFCTPTAGDPTGEGFFNVICSQIAVAESLAR